MLRYECYSRKIFKEQPIETAIPMKFSKVHHSMSSTQFIIYGSGDRGTAELRAIMSERGIAHIFVDLRIRPKKGKRCPIEFLIHRCLMTVPQVFTTFGEHIGDFEHTVEYLATMNADGLPIPTLPLNEI